MTEKHPFGYFVPENARYLLLGSFTTKEAYDDEKSKDYVWFYSNGGRNQFWPILEEIYGRELKTRKQMQKCFDELQMALGDIIIQCERKRKSNLDISLTNIVYGVRDVLNILRSNAIKKIFFTSRFVEMKFRTNFKQALEQFPNIELLTLPSPSPRYVQMPRSEKVVKYRMTLPKLARKKKTMSTPNLTPGKSLLDSRP